LEFLESIKKETKRERSKKKSEYFPTIKKEIFPTIKKEYWADIKKDNNLIKPDICRDIPTPRLEALKRSDGHSTTGAYTPSRFDPYGGAMFRGFS
jgi:hypothetical protein